jgi:hypothetical protein
MLSVTSKTKHYELDFCIGLISRDRSRPRRPPILVFVGQDKGTCFEAGIRAWLVARLRRGRRQARLMPPGHLVYKICTTPEP